jgi:predicted Rossmann-fold nucleotide-binding protein
MGVEFWDGLLDWMRDRLAAENMIAPADLDLIQTTDDPAEAVAMVLEGARRQGMAA